MLRNQLMNELLVACNSMALVFTFGQFYDSLQPRAIMAVLRPITRLYHF